MPSKAMGISRSSLPPKIISWSMAQSEPRSELMSMARVSTKSHSDYLWSVLLFEAVKLSGSHDTTENQIDLNILYHLL